jgi:hypothetical protein
MKADLSLLLFQRRLRPTMPKGPLAQASQAWEAIPAIRIGAADSICLKTCAFGTEPAAKSSNQGWTMARSSTSGCEADRVPGCGGFDRPW